MTSFSFDAKRIAHPRLPRAFFQRHPVRVARALLGQQLVRIHRGRRLAGIIVETEAYLGIPDKAAHTCNGRHTPRNHAMWCDGGHAYVYFTYGMHHCLNAVAGREGQPVAVLIRALQPTEGIDIMRRLRKLRADAPDTALCSGPARLCQALAITTAMTNRDMVHDAALCIEQLRGRALPARHITTTARIGIAYAQEWTAKPLRFYIKHNPHVSRR